MKLLKALFCVLMLLPLVVRADFSGPYAPSTWTESVGNTSATTLWDISQAPASIGLNAPGFLTRNFMTRTATSAGRVTVLWVYTGPDIVFISSGVAGYTINGVEHAFSNGSTKTGTTSFDVSSGDTYGFFVRSGDSGP